MRRREFITFLGGLTAWPITGRAQQAAKVARIGYLAGDLAGSPQLPEAFRQGLRDLGYVVGRNLVIEQETPRASAIGSPLLRSNWLRSRLMSSRRQAHSRLWPPSKRPGPSPLSSLPVAIRRRAGSSPALRGRAAISRGCPSSRRSLSASVSNCSSRPFRGSVGSLSSGRQVPTPNARKETC